MDAIKEFPADRAMDVLAEFQRSNLEHVTNKSAFLCSIMKVNRQKSKDSIAAAAATAVQLRPGPDDAKIKVAIVHLHLLLSVYQTYCAEFKLIQLTVNNILSACSYIYILSMCSDYILIKFEALLFSAC